MCEHVVEVCLLKIKAGAALLNLRKAEHFSAPAESQPSVASPAKLLTWSPLLTIAAAAFAVEIPFFFYGTPSGHDVEFHLYSWLEVLSQWKQGIVYPRWAALAHFAYGEPRFIFYPPASWILGASLAAIFPWSVVSPIYIWIVLVAAGVSMFLLARQWLNLRDATFAAVLYAVNPYHLVIVYWRSAFAELLASCVLPLLLLILLRDEGKSRRTIVPLSLLLAAAWLTNAPAAVMIHYSFALLVVAIACLRRSRRILAIGLGSAVLGSALASFYLLPAIFEQRWVNIAEATAAGSRPLDNFLFIHTGDAEHDAFNRLISWVATMQVALTLAAAWLARSWGKRNRELWISLVSWSAVCGLLMLSISNPLWAGLPKLRFMQFPWRWTLCLGVPFSLLITVAVKRTPARIGLYLATLCLLAFVWHHYQSPWWDTAADLREMQDSVYSGAGYEGTDEYTPAGADPAAVDKQSRRVTVKDAAREAIHISEWSAETKLFTADLSASDELQLHLFNYPAWRVEVNGREVDVNSHAGAGQMLIPAVAGANQVRITLVRTWDRRLGVWISLLAVLVVISVLAGWRFRGGTVSSVL